PDIVHLVTIKPYLYGGIAARLTAIPAVVSAVAGLGILFSQRTLGSSILQKLLLPLYRFAFGRWNHRIIFQNRDDLSTLRKFADLKDQKCVLIPGAGVDLNNYPYRPEPDFPPIISFASRLLRDKGVIE